MASKLRIAGRVAALGALALLMSACLKLDMDLEVSSDNTVSGSVIFAVERSVLELSGGSIDDFFGSDAPLPSDVPGVSVEDYDEGDFVGQRYTFDAVPLERFNQGDEADQLKIVREGDVFRVSGALDLETGELSGATGLSGFDANELLASAELQIRLTFPGEVTETNGQANGNTVTWVPEFGERLELQATANATGGGGDSNLTLLLIIGGIVVVLAIVVAIVLSQRRRGAAPAMAGDAGAPAAPMGAAPTPGATPMPDTGPTPPPAGPAAPPPPTPPPPPPPPDQP